MTDHKYTFEDSAYVQRFLDDLEPEQAFKVIFLKQNGEQRSLHCILPPSDKRSRIVAVNDLEGNWKSFPIDRVLWVGFPS